MGFGKYGVRASADDIGAEGPWLRLPVTRRWAVEEIAGYTSNMTMAIMSSRIKDRRFPESLAGLIDYIYQGRQFVTHDIDSCVRRVARVDCAESGVPSRLCP